MGGICCSVMLISSRTELPLWAPYQYQSPFSLEGITRDVLFASLHTCTMKRPAAAMGDAKAWVSGGSSGHPRVGRPLKRPASVVVGARGPQQSPKRGAARMMTRGSQCKSPVAAVPYVPKHQQSAEPKFELRVAADKGEVKTETHLKMNELALVRSLRKSGHMHEHKKCVHCKVGKLSPLKYRPPQGTAVKKTLTAQRCRKKGCQTFTYPHHGHPIFRQTDGPNHVPLVKQAGVLHCAAWGAKQATVQAQIEGVSRKDVDRIYTEWRYVVGNYVREKQKSIKFGDLRGDGPDGPRGKKRKVDELEADEAVFRKEEIGGNVVEWHEMVGLKRRGDRTSLFLQKRASKRSRSTRTESGVCPPPFTSTEWTELRKARVGTNTLTHTDKAPAYTQKNDGRLRDAVRHGRNKKGQKAEYTKRFKHVTASGEAFTAVGGTQSLDGWWTHGKRATRGVNAKKKKALDNRIREEQWRHWIGSADRWVECGNVISWVP